MSKPNPPTEAFPYPSLTVNFPLLLTITKNLMAAKCKYGLGAKAPSLDCDTSEIKAVDCSGFVRYALARTTGYDIGDGSDQQHDHIRNAGFKHSSVSAAKAKDGALRIAFLTPDQGGGVGHVVLIAEGFTLESYGHHGPGRREWNPDIFPFMGAMDVYALTPPTG